MVQVAAYCLQKSLAPTPEKEKCSQPHSPGMVAITLEALHILTWKRYEGQLHENHQDTLMFQDQPIASVLDEHGHG